MGSYMPRSVFDLGRAAGACSILLFVLYAGAGCKKKAAQMAPPPPSTVSVLNPIEREVVDWDEFTGRLEANHIQKVQARISGMLEKAEFEEGETIQSGQVLFRLDRKPFDAAYKESLGGLQSAQAQFALAEVEFKRLNELRGTQAISGTEYETQRERVAQGRAAITKAEGALDMAKNNLDWTEVKAEITGKVERMLMKPGNYVIGGSNDATVLTWITSTDPIYCIIDANEATIIKYQRLAAANLRVSARDANIPAFLALSDEQTFERQGVIDFVSSRMNPNTGTLLARAVFPNKNGFLKDGMFARVRVPGTGAYKAILIPGEAIGSDQAQKFVFVVDNEGVAHPRPVKLGADFDGFRVVTSGLTTQDRVIVNGLMKVRPGAKVNTQVAPWPDRPMHIAPNVSAEAATAAKATTAPSPATVPTTGPAHTAAASELSSSKSEAAAPRGASIQEGGAR
jgi:RND family efflux transporter MFP subunit